MNFNQLKTETLRKYGNFTFVDWANLIKQRGIDHKPTKAITELVQNSYPRKITRLQSQLDQAQLNNPSPTQLADCQIKLAIFQVEMQPLRDKVITMPKGEERDRLVSEIGKLDGKINQVIDTINIPERVALLTEKIPRIKEKFACIVKELEFREKKLVKRKIIGTLYYIDFENGTDLTLDYTFTNASATVDVSGDPGATDGIQANDYIRVKTGGTQWYKVTVVDDVGDTLTITPAFQQANTGAVSAILNDVSVKDGTTMANAWTHLNRATTDTVRSAGDIIKVRANQTHTIKGLHIEFDEDGTVTSYIEVRGCSAADDPWGDGSNVKPIFTFGDTAFYFYFNTDDFWILSRLDIQESSSSSGNIYSYQSQGVLFDAVDSHDNSNANGSGFRIRYSDVTITNSSSAYSNLSANVNIDDDSLVRIKDSSLYGGVANTQFGIGNCGSFVELENVTLTDHDTCDLNMSGSGRILGRNATLNSATKVNMIAATNNGAEVRIEDYGRTKLASESWYFNGIVEKDAGVIHGGGASSSAKVSPNAYCGLNMPLCIGGPDTFSDDFVIWCPAAATTVTIYIRGFGWPAFPTASELYIQAKYYDGATATRAESIASTQVLADNVAWVAFTTTFTPNSAGWVYVKVYLKKHTADCGVYVDVKPIIS